jgi:hypothetical protein
MAEAFSSGATDLTGVSTNSPTVTPMIANLPSNSTTTKVYDPAFQRFLQGVLGNVNQQNFNVPGYTEAALQNLTQNPGSIGNIAGNNMQQMIQPLLQAQQRGQQLQNQNVSDMFRKAGVGSMQSGAFAQAVRQIAGDQGAAQQQIISSNYVPLVNNATATQLGTINAGLNYPGAQASGQASLNQLLGIGMANPTQINTQGNAAQLVPGGVATAR